MRPLLVLVFLLFAPATAFLIGGCIGPRQAFERYLDDNERKTLRQLILSRFDGKNHKEVLKDVHIYLRSTLSDWEWRSILPEIKSYESLNIECSAYAQLLPSQHFKALLRSVSRANDMGASRTEVRRLVEDYIDRVVMRRRPTSTPPPTLPTTTLVPVPQPATTRPAPPRPQPQPRPSPRPTPAPVTGGVQSGRGSSIINPRVPTAPIPSFAITNSVVNGPSYGIRPEELPPNYYSGPISRVSAPKGSMHGLGSGVPQSIPQLSSQISLPLPSPRGGGQPMFPLVNPPSFLATRSVDSQYPPYYGEWPTQVQQLRPWHIWSDDPEKEAKQ